MTEEEKGEYKPVKMTGVALQLKYSQFGLHDYLMSLYNFYIQTKLLDLRILMYRISSKECYLH